MPCRLGLPSAVRGNDLPEADCTAADAGQPKTDQTANANSTARAVLNIGENVHISCIDRRNSSMNLQLYQPRVLQHCTIVRRLRMWAERRVEKLGEQTPISCTCRIRSLFPQFLYDALSLACVSYGLWKSFNSTSKLRV